VRRLPLLAAGWLLTAAGLGVTGVPGVPGGELAAAGSVHSRGDRGGYPDARRPHSGHPEARAYGTRPRQPSNPRTDPAGQTTRRAFGRHQPTDEVRFLPAYKHDVLDELLESGPGAGGALRVLVPTGAGAGGWEHRTLQVDHEATEVVLTDGADLRVTFDPRAGRRATGRAFRQVWRTFDDEVFWAPREGRRDGRGQAAGTLESSPPPPGPPPGPLADAARALPARPAPGRWLPVSDAATALRHFAAAPPRSRAMLWVPVDPDRWFSDWRSGSGTRYHVSTGAEGTIDVRPQHTFGRLIVRAADVAAGRPHPVPDGGKPVLFRYSRWGGGGL
jgi:hypothetical protein